MKDRERWVVWEESIIFLPPAIKMVFLSATMSNATEFAEWICYLHKQPCHVVYTDFRPTPLQHYAFPLGGAGLYLVVDENEQVREDNFLKLQDMFAKQKKIGDSRGGNNRMSGRIAKGGTSSGGSDIYKILKMIMERKFQPVIIFSFSRRECEQHALSMSKLDFNTEEEKEHVTEVFKNAILCLNEEDRNLHAIATSATRKWDGDSHRFIGSGEYIQMSGRAGRRGKDERGICIIMIDEQMEMITLKDMALELIHQFQYEKTLPDIGEKVSKLQKEASLLDASGEAEVAEYHKIRLDIAQLEKKMMSEITTPERVLYFFLPGRLVKIRDGGTDWGWGVVVNVMKKPSTTLSPFPSALSPHAVVAI
ncbi:Exosome rna helicase mtr4 [Thalictrum thalictroides]|uniref:Exosome rna helicase mtr4 n=1 Tax=Thalictrum thalictroides TaxID=46969 RepID=A0A7J6VTF1_THATH|nr:Exosome rna helicase mtr4 [Thalictrum thalictroides]